jgi:AraC-like DNA-binding protein
MEKSTTVQSFRAGTIFRWFVLIVFVCVVLLSLSLHGSFEMIVLNLIYSSFEEKLTEACSQLEYSYDSAYNLSLQIFNNGSIQKLLYYPPLDSIDLYNSLNHLKNYRQAKQDFIQSIYIYNKRIDSFYTTAGQMSERIYSRVTFPDREVWKLLMEDQIQGEHKLIFREIMIKTVNETELRTRVFSYIFRSLSTSPIPDAAIIINIPESWIKNILASFVVNENSSIFLLDGNGRFLLEEGKYDRTMLQSDSSFFTRIDTNTALGGYSVGKLGGEKILMSYRKIPLINWILIQVTGYNSITSQINNLRKKTIISAFIFLFIGMILSFFTSQRIYKPFLKLISRAKDLEKMQTHLKVQSFSHLILQIIKEEQPLPEQPLNELFNEHGINFPEAQKLSMILFRIDDYGLFKSTYNLAERMEIKQRSIDGVNRSFSQKIRGFCLNSDEDQFLLLFSCPGHYDSGLLRKTVVAKISILRASVFDHRMPSLTSTYLGPLGNLNEITGIYARLLELSNYRFYLGKGILIGESDTEPWVKSLPLSYSILEEQEKILKEALMSLQETAAMERLDSLLTTYKTLDYFTAIARISALLYSLVAETFNPLYHSHGMDTPGFISQMPSSLSGIETLPELKIFLGRSFRQALQQISTRDEGKYTFLIEKSLDYLRNNYTDPNLSLVTIADLLGISSDHLGRIIKKRTGRSYSAHLNEYRLEQARRLFLSSNLTVKDVAEQVGIPNDQYFYTLFRKKYGVTPGNMKLNEKIANTG